MPGSSVGPKSPIAGLLACRGAASAPQAPFLEVGVCCVRHHGLAEHGLRRLPRTRVVLTLGMAFPDVLRCLLRVTRGRHLNASGKKPCNLCFWASKPAICAARSLPSSFQPLCTFSFWNHCQHEAPRDRGKERERASASERTRASASNILVGHPRLAAAPAMGHGALPLLSMKIWVGGPEL